MPIGHARKLSDLPARVVLVVQPDDMVLQFARFPSMHTFPAKQSVARRERRRGPRAAAYMHGNLA